MSTLLDGKSLAKKIREQLQTKIAGLTGQKPGLAVVLVGEDQASKVYVGAKEKAAKTCGIYSEVHTLSALTEEKKILDLLSQLNSSKKIHGILVQLPLPKHLNTQTILNSVLPTKDVDGFHPHNLGRLLMGDPMFIPCTPKGIMTLLKESNIDCTGKKAVIIGRSLIVGKPMAQLLTAANATVTLCHSKTKDLSKECQSADILVSAIGKPKMITADFVKEGAVVIDVGINRVEGKLVGDIDFETVSKKASYITPVPGGVGPMTIAMLLENTYESYQKNLAS